MNRFAVTLLLLTALLTKRISGFSVSPPPIPKTTDAAASELLDLLVEKQKNSGTSGKQERIDSLVTTLIDSKTKFDPKECIDGPLFATCYFLGGTSTPLWERVGKLRTVNNLKGQKYSLGTDENRVVNYSEILGKAINLQASGTFIDPNRDAIKKCPYSYPVTITGASINVFGKRLKLPIQGTGVAKVLYANPNLRIFISPKGSNVTRGGGDWESAGLITVQVRVDLVDPDFHDSVLRG